MKTSNKMILGFIVVTILAFLGVHAILYNKYRKGEFVAEGKLHSEDFVRYPVAKPRVVSFDGTMWVNLIPADSFALELPRVNIDPDAGMFEYGPAVKQKMAGFEGKALGYAVRGDTLVVTGNTTTTVHRPFSAWYYRRRIPQVNLYAPSFENIILNNGQLCLRGMSSGGGRSARLTVDNSTLWIGMQYESQRRDVPENFDSLDVISMNSIIVLNSSAQIRLLRASLRDSSIITDQYSGVKESIIGTSADSRVDLVGDHLAKSKITMQ